MQVSLRAQTSVDQVALDFQRWPYAKSRRASHKLWKVTQAPLDRSSGRFLFTAS